MQKFECRLLRTHPIKNSTNLLERNSTSWQHFPRTVPLDMPHNSSYSSRMLSKMCAQKNLQMVPNFAHTYLGARLTKTDKNWFDRSVVSSSFQPYHAHTQMSNIPKSSRHISSRIQTIQKLSKTVATRNLITSDFLDQNG